MKSKKAYMEISFSWMFAIIVGAFILFLAIFFVTKFTKTERSFHETKTAKEIGILLNPLETSFEEGKSTFLSTSTNSRIYSKCSLEGEFGYQGILLKEELYEKWTDINTTIEFKNKYIFAEEPVEGKYFYLFSKPFEFPFEVASLIYIIPKDEIYCFKDAPSEIKEEIENLNQENFIIDNCEQGNIKVCFGVSTGCQISVSLTEGRVFKGSKVYSFEENDALMYAAIFSDKELYDCQVQRLAKRAYILSKLYLDKLLLPNYQGCEQYLFQDLNQLSIQLKNFQSPSDLSSMSSVRKSLYNKNKYSTCTLW